MDVGCNTESYEPPYVPPKTFSLPKFKSTKPNLHHSSKSSRNLRAILYSPIIRKTERKMNHKNLLYPIKTLDDFIMKKYQKTEIRIIKTSKSNGGTVLKKIQRKGNIDSEKLSFSNNTLGKYLSNHSGKQDRRNFKSSGHIPCLFTNKLISKTLETRTKRIARPDSCNLDISFDTYLLQKFV